MKNKSVNKPTVNQYNSSFNRVFSISKLFWIIPIIINAVLIVFGFLSEKYIEPYVISISKDGIIELSVQYYTNIAYTAFFIVILLLNILMFILFYIWAKKYVRKYENTSSYQKMKRKNVESIEHLPRQVLIFFSVVIAMVIVVFGYLFFIKDNIIASTVLAKNDMTLYSQGELSRYTGSLYLDTHQTGDKEKYYYINSPDESYRISADIYSGHRLDEKQYTIEFLPGTNTIVALYDSNNELQSGTDAVERDIHDPTHWKYRNLLIKKNNQVYGYDKLTDAGQKAFDLIYGEYFHTPDLSGEYSFDLPQSIDYEEYVKVLELYWSNNIYYDFNDYRYSTNSTSKNNISSFYVTELENDEFIKRYLDRVDEILLEIPKDMSDYDKLMYLCEYLVDNVVYYNGNREFEAPEEDIILAEDSKPDEPYETGQGALFDGRANCFGYTKALDTLLRRSGFITIPVFGSTPEEPHSWNMIQLDGDWYHLDTTWMDTSDGINYTYFLADDEQIAFTHIAEKYAYCHGLELPKADGTRYNWYVLNHLYFETASDVLEFIETEDFPTNQKVQVRLSSPDECEILYDYFQAGLAGDIVYHSSDNLFEPSVIVSFTKID